VREQAACASIASSSRRRANADQRLSTAIASISVAGSRAGGGATAPASGVATIGAGIVTGDSGVVVERDEHAARTIRIHVRIDSHCRPMGRLAVARIG
jgi:hypothetical protein